MKILVSTGLIFLSLLFTSSTYAEVVLLSKSWAVNCEENVFNEAEPMVCSALSMSKRSKRFLIIERDNEKNIVLVIGEKQSESFSRQEMELLKVLPIEINLRVDKKDLIKVISETSMRNDEILQFKAKLDDNDLLRIVKEMKKGSKINTMLNMIGEKHIDAFSLSGFTKAYETMLEKDKRRPE